MATSGIYRIENVVNGKVYVGSAIDFDARRRKHMRDLRRGVHHSHKLQAAWAKYGPEAFVFIRLLVCAPDDLLIYEQRALDAYESARRGYNVSPTAGSMRGIKRKPFTAEHRAKLSAARKCRPPEKRSPESCARIAAGIRASFARGERKPPPPFTTERRRRISEALKGFRLSPESIAKMAASKRGRVAPPEERARIAAAAKVAWVSRKARASLQVA